MKRVLVAAAVIRRDGNILIARRPDDKHQGGLWEFPGGKVEDGEPVRQALVRELEEELGIVATASRPLIRITHDYPDKSVCLDVWEVSAFRGTAHGREGQPVRWVTPAGLDDHDFPAANRPIVRAAQLPGQYLITPEFADRADLDAWVVERLACGGALLLFRAPALARADYLSRARDMLSRCRAAGAALLLHGDPSLLDAVPADGIHLPARRLRELSRRPVADDLWFSASVHDADELRCAEALDADFVTLSPVLPTLSHPGAATLGWGGFAALVERAVLPVYALGGMTPADIETAWHAGAQGVAGMRGF